MSKEIEIFQPALEGEVMSAEEAERLIAVKQLSAWAKRAQVGETASYWWWEEGARKGR